MEQKFKKTDGGIDLQALRAFCIRRIQDGAKTESGLGGSCNGVQNTLIQTFTLIF